MDTNTIIISILFSFTSSNLLISRTRSSLRIMLSKG